ncbi:coatomer subunit beta [Trichinella spiralis]|uniref:coatomer subunit beta n=1 Tax=Trichinella spiralis TaxID=6334 RepID=UPI0001EFC0EE|nr:coatomer subunit beta [Trichinella spiralis]
MFLVFAGFLLLLFFSYTSPPMLSVKHENEPRFIKYLVDEIFYLFSIEFVKILNEKSEQDSRCDQESNLTFF